jgi:cation transport protein ChaC
VELLLADWIFGYGSLIWNPEIDYRRAELATAHGYHRSFCIRSTRHRGTREDPGVVLGLDRGGSCIGVAFQLHHAQRRQAIAALYDREMQNRVYVPTLVAITLRNGAQLRALSFVANRASDAYQPLKEAELLRRLRHCHGGRGSNRDYALNTFHALRERGVHDARLARLAHQLLGEHRSHHTDSVPTAVSG